MAGVKEQVIHMIQSLPEDSTIDDIMAEFTTVPTLNQLSALTCR